MQVSSAAAQILYMLGGGHPGKIVKIACETNKQNVLAMLQKGEKIIHGRNRSTAEDATSRTRAQYPVDNGGQSDRHDSNGNLREL